MIIERFHDGKARQLYQRFESLGRLMPEGVRYVNSWINTELTTCYQVMECGSEEPLRTWIGNWDDLADFEIVPVITSAEAYERIMGPG
jgi:hypothetical protein